MAKKVTVQAALIYVMVMVAAADGHMPDTELQRIGRLVRFLPVFQGFDPEEIISHVPRYPGDRCRAGGP
jgi:tellurite resistance protein